MASDATLRDAIIGATAVTSHSFAAVLGMLQYSGGFATRALEVLGNHPEFKLRDPGLRWSDTLVDVDDFSNRMRQALVVSCELSMCISTIASRLYVLVCTVPSVEQASAFRTVSTEYWHRFKESAAQLNMGHYFARAENVELVHELFTTFAPHMPDLSATPARGMDDDTPWPYFAIPEDGQQGVENVPVQMLPLISQKVSFAFALLPRWGRVLALKCFSVLCGGNLRPIESYLSKVYLGCPVYYKDKRVLSEYIQPFDCQDGGESNAMRQLRRVFLHATLLTAQLDAVQAAYQQFSEAHPSGEGNVREEYS